VERGQETIAREVNADQAAPRQCARQVIDGDRQFPLNVIFAFRIAGYGNPVFHNRNLQMLTQKKKEKIQTT
jgi:hypothetical protein